MDGLYEWKPDKSPVRFVRRKRDVFYVAGLWRMIEKQELDVPVQEFSFVLLTTAANASVKPIHDRMPFIVRDGQADWWLNNDNMKETVLNFPDDTPLDWYPVSREVTFGRLATHCRIRHTFGRIFAVLLRFKAKEPKQSRRVAWQFDVPMTKVCWPN